MYIHVLRFNCYYFNIISILIVYHIFKIRYIYEIYKQSFFNVFQDYEDFDLANEIDELEKFLKVTPAVSTAEITLDSKSQSDKIQENGNTSSREVMLFIYLISMPELRIILNECIQKEMYFRQI